jgi:hypothetical protein
MTYDMDKKMNSNGSFFTSNIYKHIFLCPKQWSGKAGGPYQMAQADGRRRTEEANGCQRTATPPHNWRGNRRGRPQVTATNRHRTALPSTRRTAEQANVRRGPRMPDVRTRDNLVW